MLSFDCDDFAGFLIFSVSDGGLRLIRPTITDFDNLADSNFSNAQRSAKTSCGMSDIALRFANRRTLMLARRGVFISSFNLSTFLIVTYQPRKAE